MTYARPWSAQLTPGLSRYLKIQYNNNTDNNNTDTTINDADDNNITDKNYCYCYW